MGLRKQSARVAATIVAAYLLIVQAAVGGFDSARHSVAALSDPLGVICLTQDGEADGHGGAADHRGSCCTLGCLSAALAPQSTPQATVFAYAPSTEVRRRPPGRDRPVSALADRTLKPPRAPPSVA